MPITSTLSGSAISSREPFPAKEYSPMVFNVLPKSTVSSEVQAAKAYSPTVSRPSGRVRVRRPAQSVNAFLPITRSPEPKPSSVMLAQ